MGCFCHHLVPSLPQLGLHLNLDVSASLHLPFDPLIPAVSAWLQARWLPAPAFAPDPRWLEIEWPEFSIDIAAMGVLSALVVARLDCQLALKLDLGDPSQAAALARIVATLNLRLPALLALDVDLRSWAGLALLNEQLDLILKAQAEGTFGGAGSGFGVGLDVDLSLKIDLALWRPLIIKIKALAPLIAIARSLNVDLADESAPQQIGAMIRLLAQIRLPPLLDLSLVLRLVAQNSAVNRLRLSLGFDPRLVPFGEVVLAVQAKLDLVLRGLSLIGHLGVRLEAGVLLGLPNLLPNPSMLLNEPTLRIAASLSASLVARFAWQVPRFEALALLTVGSPVAALVRGFVDLGIDPICLAPCDSGCDAARAMRDLKALGSVL